MNYLNDYIQWDAVNWKRAVKKWNLDALKDIQGKRALGLGECEGGMSIMFAQNGASVVCSDYNWLNTDTHKAALDLTSKYNLSESIEFRDIDALNIPYENEFDIVFFKSILGGIARNGEDEKISQVFSQINKALKPGGTVYFVENMEGCSFVKKMRRKYSRACNNGWNYLSLDKLDKSKGDFKVVSIDTVGTLACIGPKEGIRRILGYLDCILDIFNKNRYIVSCVLKKQ